MSIESSPCFGLVFAMLSSLSGGHLAKVFVTRRGIDGCPSPLEVGTQDAGEKKFLGYGRIGRQQRKSD
ncbi:MAG TPA: hypothetical protein VNO55_16105 [Polyangia bacterium]|nr:hypothetical protein [Polyangia bacterium]